jgi:hypothetical protein
MHIIMPFFGGTGGGLFKESVTHGIIVLFSVCIGAVLLLRNALFRMFVCFHRTLWCFFGIIISVVDCRHSSCSYNVESSFVE